VLGGVDERLAGGGDQRLQRRAGRAVADDDHLDGHAVRLLHLGGHRLQPAATVLACTGFGA
jgi:hypothetical protein